MNPGNVHPPRPDRDGASPADTLAFERMLSAVLAELGNVPAERMRDAITGALRRMIDFLDFDRSTVLEFGASDGEVEVVCSVARDDIEPFPGDGSFTASIPWLLGELRAGRLVALASPLDDLPKEAAVEAEYCRRIGLRSHIGIPMIVGGRITGAIGFSAFHRARAWPAELVARLTILGGVFAELIARSRRDVELVAALAEIGRLKERLEAENVYLRQAVRTTSRRVLMSHSPRFNEVLDEVRQVAATNSTVLLQGETGTGKEVLAELIHNSSGRKDRPMVKVSCAALPASLIEAELFGREKGAYTGALARQSGRFEIADQSTIFLDEVGELPLELQSKLLRVLQDGRFERLGAARTIEVDVRVIAATNRDLVQAVGEGRFREDLYYRLNVFPIVVPPLRERRADIPLLAWEFVQEFSVAMGKPIERIADASMVALQAYPWPGNVRELRNLIERAMILARGPTLHIALGRSPLRALPNAPTGTLEEAERAHIVQALERVGWRIRGPGGAAEVLSMKPTTLESRMKKLGVQRPGQQRA